MGAKGQGGAAPAAKPVNLALQGGGSHGAFTWGVLDRLLEDGRIAVDGVSGTSAGAMNGAMLAYGHAIGGRDGAREALERFWRKVSDAWTMSPLRTTWLDRVFGGGGLDHTPAYQAFGAITRLLSPYQFNLLDLNPLRDLLREICDFDRLREAPIKLFVCATNVRSGKLKVFDPHEITPEALLASACLPQYFRAVEIDGEAYWDGGYLGNPAIFPLMYRCEANDVVLVQVNPIATDRVPRTANEIDDRVNEIGFNSTLMREMRAIAFVTQLIEEGRLRDPHHLHRIYFHMIEAEAEMARLGVSSKFNADWGFLTELRDLGRQRAEAWLATGFDALGARSTLDLGRFF